MSALLAPDVVRSDGLVGSANETAEQLAYYVALATVFVDLLGQNFAFVLIPYAKPPSQTTMLTGAVISIAPLGRILGGVVMPVLADRLSRKYVVWASMLGSSIAYGLSSRAASVGY